MNFRLFIVAFSIASAHADTFGSGANQFDINFVTIGNAGNTDDNTGCGSVGYTFRMGVNEVSRGMISAVRVFATGPADITNAVGLSPYGTMTQNGNVHEWGESGCTAPNDSAGEARVVRGGSRGSEAANLMPTSRIGIGAGSEVTNDGFRVFRNCQTP
jgi:hypothetical protein